MKASIVNHQYPILRDITYLDHAGATLYPQSLMHRVSKDLRENLYGNPHSASPSSQLSTQRVKRARRRVLQFFKADPEHFDVVFVANATAAIKLVGDAFRDQEGPGFWYGYHRDAHTSLVGIRRLAAQSRCFKSDDEVESWLTELSKSSEEALGKSAPRAGLFAYPAQSNMNGYRLPLEWPGRLRSSQIAEKQNIYTLLDAAAYAMTAQLDLSDKQSAPDFTVVSFYKIFGFPDLGALVVRKTAGKALQQRRYFGGGTVDMVTVIDTPWQAKKKQTIHDYLEDGTLPFHCIIALDLALTLHAELFGSMTMVSKRTADLVANLYHRLATLRHGNGRAVCVIYKDPKSQYGNTKTQGPTIAFNIQNARGGWIGKSEVERLAIARNIHLRTGGVCNAGGIATFCGLEYWELRRNFLEGMRCGDDLDILGGKPTGIVRVSLGAMSTQRDADVFVNFIKEFFVEPEIAAVPKHLTYQPSNEKIASNTVNGLQIFPVIGCLGWQIPPQTRWPFNKTRLAWDQEWRILSEDEQPPLSPNQYPAMKNIRPFLDVEAGTLKLVAPVLDSVPHEFIPKPTNIALHTHEVSNTTSDVSTSLLRVPNSFIRSSDRAPALPNTAPEYEELIISLWGDSCSEDQSRPNSCVLSDSYTNKTVTNFFVKVLGMRCILARVPPVPSAVNQHDQHHVSFPRRNGPLPPPHNTLTVDACPWEESQANLTLSHPQTFQHYLRVGDYYFESDSPLSLTGSRSFCYLPNKHDRSPTAQSPTLQINDEIQAFTPEEAAGIPSLQACITSTGVGDYNCSVWNCLKDFATLEELTGHMTVHKAKGRWSQSGNGRLWLSCFGA